MNGELTVLCPAPPLPLGQGKDVIGHGWELNRLKLKWNLHRIIHRCNRLHWFVFVYLFYSFFLFNFRTTK